MLLLGSRMRGDMFGFRFILVAFVALLLPSLASKPSSFFLLVSSAKPNLLKQFERRG